MCCFPASKEYTIRMSQSMTLSEFGKRANIGRNKKLSAKRRREIAILANKARRKKYKMK